MKKLVLLFMCAVAAATCARADEPTVPNTREQWLDAVAALKKAVPEFNAFCDGFPAAELKIFQNDKKVRVLTTIVQALISDRYSGIVIYDVAYKPGFKEIEKIVKEHIGVHRTADLESMKSGQVLAPIELTRAEMQKLGKEGEDYLDRLLDERKKTKK